MKTLNRGFLPIHSAAQQSSLDVLKFLVRVYPESVTMVKRHRIIEYEGYTFLHLAMDTNSYFADERAMIEYILHL